MILLFTDTKTEDPDLYRFIEQTVEAIDAQYISIEDGRDIWQVFEDYNFIGNSRIALCSQILKQRLAKRWIKANYKPNECTLYLGIDWSELHRTAAPIKNWSPYLVEFPMTEEPYLDKEQMLLEIDKMGIKRPRLYDMGFAHNNCNAMCVRAGQGHWKQVYEKMPDVYKTAEDKEQELIKHIGRDVSMMQRTIKGVKTNLTLKQLREEMQSNNTENIDALDIGGCGCFVEDEEDAPSIEGV